tara:strand:- start:5906 stop:6091 length:186 start_codon:yes stop_codon:yes gene_type:complete
MKNKLIVKTYDGYEEILDRVRGIVRAKLGAHNKTKEVIKEINAFEDEISSMLDGRFEDTAS